jgi:serine phosphatase RsbU (regulator of sigma subunit)
MPMGLLSCTEYVAGAAILSPGSTLLLFTDGLTDSIPGNDPAGRLRGAILDNPAKTMSNLKSLIDPRFKEDDVTILLVKGTSDRRCGFRRIRERFTDNPEAKC